MPKDLSKYSGSIKSFYKNIIHRNYLINPNRDWTILITLFFLINIAIIASSTYFFFLIKGDQIFNVVENTKSSSDHFNKATLEQILNYYSDKQGQFTNLKSTHSTTTDPSL